MNSFLFETLIKNPVYGILVTILGLVQLYDAPISRHSGILFGVGISMIAYSGWHHYRRWKRKRTNSSDFGEKFSRESPLSEYIPSPI